MKQCPYCKAQLQENATFCLYCMKSLDNKKSTTPTKSRRYWLAILLGVLVLVLIGCWYVYIRGREPMPENAPSVTTTTRGTENAATSAENSAEEEEVPSDTTDTPTDGVEPPENQPETPTSPTAEPSTVPTTAPTTTPTTTPTTPTTTPTSPTTAPTTPTEPSAPDDLPATEEDIPTAEESAFTYRTARAGDDFSASYTGSENDIVITGVSKNQTVYHIPDSIDGKRVLAIASNAFYGSGAKQVYVSASVKTIWEYAFNGCDLTDIYFRGKAIYVDGKAFQTIGTIHCAADCHDRNFRYFKNSAVYYDATYEEWNG